MLQADLDALIREIPKLSHETNNRVKVQLKIERLTLDQERNLQSRYELVAVIADVGIEEELPKWTELLDIIDKTVVVAHEYLNKECRLQVQSSMESMHSKSRQPSNLKLSRI